MSIWDNIEETTKSLGGAMIAPIGAVYDIAAAPLKGDDDEDLLSQLAGRTGDFLDPFMNPETFSGLALTKAMHGANWLLNEGVNEPISTALILSSHSAEGGGGGNDWGAFFSGEDWGKAYEIAQHQNAGQSFAATFDEGDDPFELHDQGIRSYDDFATDHPVLAPVLSTTANVVGMWYLDPLVIAGKAGSIHRAFTYNHKLGATERGKAFALLNSEVDAARFGRQGAASRTDKWLEWTEGKNRLGRKLEAPEILHGTPELKKYAAEPHVIAGLMADANKIGDKALRWDTKKRILSVAAGDTSQIGRLRGEVAESGAIADSLSNMLKKGTLDLKHIAADERIAKNPAFIAHLEGQLDNLNSGQAIDKFMDGWNARIEQVLGAQGTMPNLPGVHAAGQRAILRQNEAGNLRALDNSHRKMDEWAAKHWAQAQSANTLFQKGFHSVPIVMVKTVGLPASVYTKFPVKVSDSLRQVQFTGMANLHAWGDATHQLDSMMRLSNVSAGERMSLLSKAFVAKSEPEKQRIIERVENLSMHSMAKHFSEKFGEDIDRGFIEQLMVRHATDRGGRLSQLRGRAYAATETPEEMLATLATRGAGIRAAEDAATLEASRGKFSATKVRWRVDQVNDDGTPLALPLLEPQLANKVPLLDMNLASKVLKREFGPLARLSRAWAEDAKELQRAAELKRLGHQGLDKFIARKQAGMDWTIDAAQKTMRVWKFGVLFRLGYPMRVLIDDHARIWTQLSAATFYGDNGKEFISNWRYNRTLPGEARHDLHNLKVRRQEILEELEGDRMVVHPERQADLKRLKREMGSAKGQITRLQKRIEAAETKRSLGLEHEDIAVMRERIKQHEATLAEKDGGANYLLEELGDYGPDELKRELGSIEDVIAGGPKALRKDKRTIGTADVKLPGGLTVPGAFSAHEPMGKASREAASSRSTFEHQLEGVEDRMYSAQTRGAHRTIPAIGEDGSAAPGHLDAWADVLNYQFRMSPVAMHFIKGGDVDEFISWVKLPEQAQLRQRLSHYAHDPEDWGHRVSALVHDYIPNDELRQAVISGRVSSKFLGKKFQDPTTRPAVHGRAIADNLGTSHASQLVGNTMNRIYRWLGEMPTDRLSRHPFFNSVYRQHVKEQHAIKRAGLGEGHRFTQADLDDLTTTARKLALHDLKRTLFDISAHSHAAHVMRFVSPFFAAHQEVLARWWRIAGDDPSVVRRFAQIFDMPRHLNLVVDEEGNPVKPGDAVSPKHRLLLQLPEAWGGPSTDIRDGKGSHSKWQISENSFNLILQNGIGNPGAGPIVTVPVEYFAKKYAEHPEIERVARIFNPYPPDSPQDTMLPATMKRLLAVSYAKGGPGFGVGQREYNNAMGQNAQDLITDFKLAHGREPTKTEMDDIMLQAGRETNVDMTLRVLWNAGSPFPASPKSKYAAVQAGWRQIQDQARAEGKDYEWAYAQFKEKWGEVYMPLIYSSSNNPAGLEGTPAEVTAIKRYRGVLDRVDPKMSRMVIGAYAEDLGEGMNQYSQEASAYLRDAKMEPGSSATYFSRDEPAQAMKEQQARRGWQKYGELTGALTAQAQQMGLASYRDSEALVAIKKAGVLALARENWAFAEDARIDPETGDWLAFGDPEWANHIADMRTLVKSPALIGDTERTDIRTLAKYLQVRDAFTQIFAARDQAGFGGPDAQANAQYRALYTALVGALVESNTMFETYMYNGTIERDPLLTDEGVVNAA